MGDAKERAEKALARGQEDMEMLDVDEEQYSNIYESVQREVKQLRVILESAEAKEQERVWLKQQTHGDLDDSRLVDGATGEKKYLQKTGKGRPPFLARSSTNRSGFHL